MGLVEKTLTFPLELLTDEQKAVYIHGFIIGLMSGHTEELPQSVEYYMDIQERMFDRLQLSTKLIQTDVLDKLKELDIFQLYQATKE